MSLVLNHFSPNSLLKKSSQPRFAVSARSGSIILTSLTGF
jgi:hypothetical protein